MNFTIMVENELVFKGEFDVVRFARLIQDALRAPKKSKSTIATIEQMSDLLGRVAPESSMFLKEIAASAAGFISWNRMREIFHITELDDWNAYVAYGRGITRAMRKITGDSKAQLVWWIDKEWEDLDWDDDKLGVYVDGPALEALRANLS